VLTQAWDRAERKSTIVETLKAFAGAENIVERSDARIRELGATAGDGFQRSSGATRARLFLR